LRLGAPSAEDTGSIPGQGTEIPHATQLSLKKEKWRGSGFQLSFCVEVLWIIWEGSTRTLENSSVSLVRGHHTSCTAHQVFQAGIGRPLPAPTPAERDPSSCPAGGVPADPSLTALTHVPPCPPDDADLVELKQELEAVGDFRHRSPSRSLSVPSRPRPPHPPQRPPPPSKTPLAFHSPRCLLGITTPFLPAERMALKSCCWVFTALSPLLGLLFVLNPWRVWYQRSLCVLWTNQSSPS